MDQQLTTGTGLICEQHPTGNEMDQSFPPSTSTSRFGTPQLTNCQCRHQLALDFQYYTIAMENLKSNINSLRVNGLKDQSSHIMKKNQQRLADYTSLHQFPASSRPQKIVLKGLPISADIQDIKSDLENQGYIVGNKCYHKLGAFQKHSKTQLNSHPSQQTQARISKTRLQTSPKILKAHNIASKPINPDHKQYVSEEFKTLFIQGNRARKAWQFTRCPQDKRTLNNLQNKIHRKVRSLTNKTWENTLNSLSVKGGSLRGMSKALRKKRTPVSTLKGPNNIALSDSDKEESLACSLETQFQDNDITNETTDIILLTGSSRITFLTKIISMIPPDTTQTF
ncbi:hypothetical protein TNIN_35201 [Trichonephila inaurata madagascariensis]|uniref:Uncharacterized protein n=1 Tax=Trichonephila inaurata madagascariensis TaxID=2747483 RepID=A0A8X6IRP3_9ARAC|nr:hypothetical protein TNIN_35201 [Trichonephila inaurata madagascariensis]